MTSLTITSSGIKFQCNYSEFHIFDGHCYFGNRRELNWTSAQRFCNQEKGHLADVQSSYENAAVTEVLSKSNVAWIGLNRIHNKRDWMWRLNDSSMPSNYTKWIKGQPDSHSTLGEHCVEITLSKDYQGSNDTVGRWNDNSCNMTLASVCKKIMSCRRQQPML